MATTAVAVGKVRGKMDEETVGCQKVLFYNDNQILVSVDVKLVKNRILTPCSLVVSGYQCCRAKDREDIMFMLCVTTSHSQITRRRKTEDETMTNLWILLRMDWKPVDRRQ
jgi:hypothetical protein